MYFAMFASRGARSASSFHFRDLPLEGTACVPTATRSIPQAVFDLDAGPVTITLPDAGNRFMSMLIIDEDHYALEVDYGAGRTHFRRENVDTRYVFARRSDAGRPRRPSGHGGGPQAPGCDRVEQPGGPGKLELPNWDKAARTRCATHSWCSTRPSRSDKSRGRKDEVDPVRHLIGTASAWGLNPDKDAIYLNITPAKNDGATIYRLEVPGEVPVDRVLVGHRLRRHRPLPDERPQRLLVEQHHCEEGRRTAPSMSNLAAATEVVPNCLPTMPGWNYMVRLYRPRAAILNGSWKFPEARPAT